MYGVLPINRAVVLLNILLGLNLPVARGASAQQDEFDSAITGLTERLTPALVGKTVAVFEFPDLEGRTSNLSRMVSEQLTTELVQQLGGGGTVVERRQVIQVLAELKLQRTDLTAEEVSRVGRQLGADAIILGSVTVLGEQLIVNARAVTVSGGRVVSAGRRNVRGSPQLLALAQSGHNVTSLTGRRTAEAQVSTPARSSSVSSGSDVSRTSPQDASMGTDRVLEERSGPVTLRINRCTHQQDGVRCAGTVLSTEDYRFGIWTMGFPKDQIFAYSRLIDELGRVHVLGGDTNINLVAGVPFQVVMVFPGVLPLRKIPLIELQTWIGNNPGVMRFRDVPVR